MIQNSSLVQKLKKPPPETPLVNDLPWGPGTDNPTPWCCYFCDLEFGTFREADEHETECARRAGWAFDENRS